MNTRHFHTTSLIIIGLVVLFFLSLAIGQKPSLPKFPSQQPSSLSPIPSPVVSVLYYDYANSYEIIASVIPGIYGIQGIYGAPTEVSAFNTILKYNNNIYLHSNSRNDVINVLSHSLNTAYSFPLSISPSTTKALFLTTDTPNNSTQSAKVSLLTTDFKTKFAFPNTLGDQPKVLCWSADENTVVFTLSQNYFYFLNLKNDEFTKFPLAPNIQNYSAVYCNSLTDAIFFKTKNGVFMIKFLNESPKKLPLSQKEINNFQNPIFSSDTPTSNVLLADNKNLFILNLSNGMEKTVYTATGSAIITPYLWRGTTIVFTQENIQPENNTYYLDGKLYNTENQTESIFDRHQSDNESSLGAIIPINWLIQQPTTN